MQCNLFHTHSVSRALDILKGIRLRLDGGNSVYGLDRAEKVLLGGKVLLFPCAKLGGVESLLFVASAWVGVEKGR